MVNLEPLDPKAFIVEGKETLWKTPLSHREWRERASSYLEYESGKPHHTYTKKRRHFWLRFSGAALRMDRQATSRQAQSAKALRAEPSLAYSFSPWIRSIIFNAITATTVDPPAITNSIHCGHGNSILVTSLPFPLVSEVKTRYGPLMIWALKIRPRSTC